jgi:DNA-binding CsgD family transcriptional regulator
MVRSRSSRRSRQRLVVSPATAKTHVSRSMVKLNVRDRAKLVALAYQTGFTHVPLASTPALPEAVS